MITDRQNSNNQKFSKTNCCETRMFLHQLEIQELGGIETFFLDNMLNVLTEHPKYSTILKSYDWCKNSIGIEYIPFHPLEEFRCYSKDTR